MLSATDTPSPAERQAALDLVPWYLRARLAAGRAFGLLRDQSADIIDIAVGTIHMRAALVAFQEGADALFQVALDVVESSIAADVLVRTDLRDPLGLGEALHTGEYAERLRLRAVRIRTEDAAIRLAAAGNHLTNAFLRLAWEANAATAEDVRTCGFDPDSNRFDNWADTDRARRGLNQISTKPLAVLPAFVLTPHHQQWSEADEVKQTRWLRHRIVHRDRPNYADAPAVGRKSLWTGDSFKVTFPPRQAPTGSDPSLSDTRETIVLAGEHTLNYAEEIWTVALRVLAKLGVHVDHVPGTVTVRAEFHPGQPGPRLPREARDPGPFLIPGTRP